MVLIYHRRQCYCTALKLFFNYCQSCWFYEINIFWIADLDDSGLVFVEFVVKYNACHHPITFGVVAGDKISRYCAPFLFHVFPL